MNSLYSSTGVRWLNVILLYNITYLPTLSPTTFCSVYFLPSKIISNLRAFAYTMPPACNAFLPSLCLHKCHPPPPRPPPHTHILQAPLKPSLPPEVALGFPNPQSSLQPVSCVNIYLPCLLLSIWPVLASFAIYLLVYLSIYLFIFYEVPYLILRIDYQLEGRDSIFYLSTCSVSGAGFLKKILKIFIKI